MIMKKPSIKLKKPKNKPKKPETKHITNDTVAEHREKVLSGGQKFKYPVQYERHKLVINTIVISVFVLILISLFGWWQLYVQQNSSAFFYKVTQTLRLPVASVDGESARYSDYLLNYRTAKYYLSTYDEVDPESENGRLQLDHEKRNALNIALADAYARKLAKQNNITISSQEINQSLDAFRVASNGTLTRETSNASSKRFLGLDESDLRTLTKNSLLRVKVAFFVDKKADKVQKEITQMIASGDKNIGSLAKKISKKYPKYVIVDESGLVDKSSTFDGLRANELAQLKKGRISTVIRSVTNHGYYFVKITTKTDKQVSFRFIRVPLTTFNQSLGELEKSGAIKEYITIDNKKQSAKS